MAIDLSTDNSAAADLAQPSPDALLGAHRELSRILQLPCSEEELVDGFLRRMEEIFPARHFLVRLADLRAGGEISVRGATDVARAGLRAAALTFRRADLDAGRVHPAVAESAQLRVSERWDSPFFGVGVGFALPLVAGGELFGVLDVGYPLGLDGRAADRPTLEPLAQQLSSALRGERLHCESAALLDYQSQLIEHANALILGVNVHWRIVLCNGALCRLIGYSRDALIGRDVRDHVPERERVRITTLLGQALAGGDTGTFEIELATRSGQTVGVVWSVATIRGGNRQKSLVAVGQDQSQLRALQGQIIQAEKLATLGQLAAGVVHELNNPLTSISVYAEHLVKKYETRLEDGDERVADDLSKLRRIAAGAERILVFSRDLVQYAKPASGRTNRVNLNAIVLQSLSFCEHLFAGGVALERDLAADLPPIEIIPGQLEQVVINLVTNAVHACESSGLVRVCTRQVEDELEIAVADSGPGISEDDRERIFEPFFTTKPDGQGTGLGLSIVQNIVHQHRGRVEARTPASGGAELVCVFPLAR